MQVRKNTKMLKTPPNSSCSLVYSPADAMDFTANKEDTCLLPSATLLAWERQLMKINQQRQIRRTEVKTHARELFFVFSLLSHGNSTI